MTVLFTLLRNACYMKVTLCVFFTALLASAQGVITTFAGSAKTGFSGDGGSAVSAQLSAPAGVATDAAGNLYIADGSNRVRKVNAAGIISTVAGGGAGPGLGDGGLATNANVPVNNIAVDGAGNIYIASGSYVRKVNTSGILSTVAGNGLPGYSGDGGLATSAQIFVAGVAVDSAGNFYLAEPTNNRVRKVSTGGIISTVAGNGKSGFSGDGGQATSAMLALPQGIAVDNAGNVYFADNGSRIRKVEISSGIITTVAGNGSAIGVSENVPATSSGMTPSDVAVDGAGNLFITDTGVSRIRKVNTSGLISTVAGSLVPGFSGDGGPATSASLFGPMGVAVDLSGNLYIADTKNSRVRKVTGVAGTGSGLVGGILSLNPSSLSFSYKSGEAPQSQALGVSSSTSLTFTASTTTSSGQNWLVAGPPNGRTPMNVLVFASPGNLSPGTYTGVVVITPSGGGPINVPVTMTITGTTGAGQPIIRSDGVVNATGYQAKLAPDTVFVIFGSNLGPANIAISPGPNYPATLGGTSISFVPSAGGSPVPAKLVYSVAGQVAGLLPSSIAPGSYAVRVTYSGLTSDPQTVTVVARSFGIATADSSGTGPAQASIGNVNSGLSLVRFTTGSVAFNGNTYTLTPAHPGDTLVFWGTGGGADSANDSGGTSGDQTAVAGFVVIVGGRQITPVYAGASSGYPGLWQINFTLPADIATSCFASAQVSAGGELSNTVSIAIAAQGQNACSDPDVSPAIFSKLDTGGDIVIAAFGVFRLTDKGSGITTEGGSGSVAHYSAARYLASISGIRVGDCIVRQRIQPDPGTADAFLDAGARLPLAGPNLAAATALTSSSTTTGPVYYYLPGVPILMPGKYTLTGNGGTQVGSFSSSAVFPTAFAVTNLDAITAIDRSQPLAVNWTGSGFDQVSLLVSSTTPVGSSQRTVTVTCSVPAGPGTYSIPAATLAYLGAATALRGSFSATAVAASGTFTATLAAGGQTELGLFGASIGISKSVPVQ